MFEVGSILLMIEAFNENRAGCFGWQVERLFLNGSNGSERDVDVEKGKTIRLKPDAGSCTHHHPNKKNLVGRSVNPGMLISFCPAIVQSCQFYVWTLMRV